MTGDDFSRMNLDLAEAVRRFGGKRAVEIRCKPAWIEAVKHRLVDWNAMTEGQRDVLWGHVRRLFSR